MPSSRGGRLLALILAGSMSAGAAACSAGPEELTSVTVAQPPSPKPAPDPAPQTGPPAYATSSSPAAPTPAAPTTSDACDQEGALIAEAQWITVEGQDSLEVTPTALLRTCARAAPAWSELVELVPGADTPGMADQLRCHVLFAPRKGVWHLEPWRPSVDVAEMIRTRCNPGAPDPDQP